MNIDVPLVSVIALCYNQAEYVVNTLDSILAQTYPNIQLIITDDYSTDDSVEVIQKWIDEKEVKCEFIKHTSNQGITKTCNDGLQNVKGKYYQIIACDDLMYPYKIQDQVQVLEEKSELGLVYGDVNAIDEYGNVLYPSFNDKFNNSVFYRGYVFEQMLKQNFIPAMSVLVRTSSAREVGGYDENLWYEDWDMWLRITQKYKIEYTPKIVGSYRRVENSSIRTKPFDYYITRFCIIRKYLHLTEFKTILKSHLRSLFTSLSYSTDKRKLFLMAKCAWHGNFVLFSIKHTMKNLLA